MSELFDMDEKIRGSEISNYIFSSDTSIVQLVNTASYARQNIGFQDDSEIEMYNGTPVAIFRIRQKIIS